MVGGLRFVAAILSSCYTVALADHAAVEAPHDHVRHKRSGDASGGADGGEPSLSTPTWTVVATGTGTSYAQACDRELAAYDTILSYGITPTDLLTLWATTTSYTAKTTRLCDGRARVVGSLTPVHIGSVLTASVPTVTYTGPAPSCSVNPSDCSWLRKSYISADSSYSSSLSQYPDAPPGDEPTVPRCYIPGPPLPVCGQCTIHGDHVELLYFPVTTEVSRDMCALTPTSPVTCPYGPTYSNNDTIKGFATAPCPYIDTEPKSTTDSGPSTVINGTTLYSNRAYISYNTLYATNSCGRVGGTYSNGLVTVASSDVYSLSGYHFYMNRDHYSFNFGDLSAPVPASAYLAQATCDNSGSPLSDGDMLNGVYGGALGFCSTIIDEAYKPWIAVPPQMRAIDPQFKDCLLGLDALYDPPRLMVSEATLDGPSATTSANAEPQQGASIAHTTASPTAASEVVSVSGLDLPGSSPAASEQAGQPDVSTSTTHTAMMESQTPQMTSASSVNGDSSANAATTDARNGREGDAPTSTSTSSSLVFVVHPYTALFWCLLLSYIAW